MSTQFIIDSRDRLGEGEHDFVSANTSSDFVIKLPQSISKFTITDISIPITYYVFNDNTNKIIYRINGDLEYYLVTIPKGTYTSKSIQPVLAAAIDAATQLSNPIMTTPLANTTVTFDKVAKKIQINVDTPGSSIQFIANGDPDGTQGIPFADPLGFPSELLPGAELDPLRNQLTECARLLGLTQNDVTPNPFNTNDDFALGVQFAFNDPGNLPGDPILVSSPNIVNLQGENYIFIKSDLAGLGSIRQGKIFEVDINENDISVIANSSLDRGIIAQIKVDQIPFTVLSVDPPQNTILLSETTDTINFKLTFRDNILIDLNGSDINIAITI